MHPTSTSQLDSNEAVQQAGETLSTKEDRWQTLKDQVFNGDWDQLESADWWLIGEVTVLKSLLVLILLFVAWTISAWVSGIVARGLRRVKFDETLTKFSAKLVRWGILGIAGIMCLSHFGIETTSFAAVIGAAGLAVGLAFQGTLSNFAAGAMLLIFRPYKVGDVVNVAGNLGKVFEIELFTTAIDTFDNRRIIVPNSQIYGSVIENITYHSVRRFDVEVGTSYDADIDETRRVLERAFRAVPQIVADPEPAVVLGGLGASSVDWIVRGWATNDDYGTAKQELIRAVKMQLDAAEIEIPYPHLELQMAPPTSVANAA
ncbi:MAG: mechanosensitive ion channel family protein [Planctomycetota bacterium]